MHLVDDKIKYLNTSIKLLNDLGKQTEGDKDILPFVTASLS